VHKHWVKFGSLTILMLRLLADCTFQIVYKLQTQQFANAGKFSALHCYNVYLLPPA